MKILCNIIITSTFATLCSCYNSSTHKIETTKSDSIVSDTTNIFIQKRNNLVTFTNNETSVDTVTTIKFPELSISIHRFIIYDEKKNIDQIQKDTVRIYVEPGETIEGKLISILSNQLTDLKLEQRYETSITIMNEGPHCDLTEWKHFYSDWKSLKQNNKGQFICDKYFEKDYEKFPKVSIDDLKQTVKEQCGDEWLTLVENIKTPTEYPSGVAISRYYLRVTGQRMNNSQIITKLIVIETPMGC